jgi:hypothetical protein
VNRCDETHALAFYTIAASWEGEERAVRSPKNLISHRADTGARQTAGAGRPCFAHTTERSQRVALEPDAGCPPRDLSVHMQFLVVRAIAPGLGWPTTQ